MASETGRGACFVIEVPIASEKLDSQDVSDASDRSGSMKSKEKTVEEEMVKAVEGEAVKAVEEETEKAVEEETVKAVKKEPVP